MEQQSLLSSHQQPPQNPESHEPKFCRNCHSTQGNDFIVPCKCTGSMKYVHRKCLDEWRTVSPNPDSFSQCDVCQYRYVFRDIIEEKSPTCPSWITFTSLMTLDITLVLFLWQVLVFCCVGFVFVIDLGRERDKIGMFRGWPSFGIDYFCGLFFFFFFLGSSAILFGMAKLLMYCLGVGNDCCSQKVEMTTYHYRYDYNPMWDVFFFWYFWSIWTPYPVRVPGPICYCPGLPGGCGNFGPGDCNFGDCGSGCTGGNCSGGDCNGGGGGNDGGALAIIIGIIIAVVIIIAIIGVFVGILLLFKIIFDITVRRAAVLQKRTLTLRQVVMEIDQAL